MTTLGILGAGQLGWMLGLAAAELGIDIRFYDPNPDSPGGRIAPLTVGSFADADAIAAWADGCDHVTYEVESIPVAPVRALTARVRVDPSPDALAAAQDRRAEKETFAALGIATAPWRPAANPDELVAALADLGTAAVVKAQASGFDGRGQRFIDDPHDTAAALRVWDELGAAPVVAEGRVPFDREVSIVGVRGRYGEIRTWPVVENRHADGILRTTLAPAPNLTPELQADADTMIGGLLNRFGYVGVACIELFQVGTRLLANEFAPRVHNSGHWSIEGAATSQFANHVRAVCGLPLGPTDVVGVAAMVNVIGDAVDPAAVAGVERAVLHDYAKAPRPARKIGHVTVCAPDAPTLAARLDALAAATGLDVRHG